MQVRVVKMQNKGVEQDRRALRDLFGHRGVLIIMDVSDQGATLPGQGRQADAGKRYPARADGRAYR
jgi:hypothetical protein